MSEPNWFASLWGIGYDDQSPVAFGNGVDESRTCLGDLREHIARLQALVAFIEERS